MPIKFRCPHCEQFLGISQNQAGRVTDCPRCGRSIRVPALDGTVASLPPPKLNLQDDQLRAALGTLATAADEVAGEGADDVQENPSPQPSSVRNRQAQAVPAEIVSNPQDQIEVRAEPVSQDREASEFPVEEDPLAQLASAPRPHPIQVKNERKGLQFGPAILFIASMVSIFCGLMIGSAMTKAPEPAATTPESSSPAKAVIAEKQPEKQVLEETGETGLFGTVTYSKGAGTAKPDMGARVLLLPMHRAGTAKLPHQGFRVGADDTDRELLMAAAKVLGGNFTLADSQGQYQANVPKQERYGMLVASSYLPRPESDPLTDRCRDFLTMYFDRPDLVIGNVKYEFHEIDMEISTNQPRNIEFSNQ